MFMDSSFYGRAVHRRSNSLTHRTEDMMEKLKWILALVPFLALAIPAGVLPGQPAAWQVLLIEFATNGWSAFAHPLVMFIAADLMALALVCTLRRDVRAH
jgi:hypothetical protein